MRRCPRLVVLPDPGVDEVGAALPREVARQGEGAHDEAVGVHDVLRDRPVVGVPVLARQPIRAQYQDHSSQ